MFGPLGAQPKEHEVFIQYYSKLTSILQVDLTPHFVTAKIITLSDEDEITKASTTSHRAAMKMLLKPVSSSLETGYTTSFYKMLEIMQQHGNDAAQHLSGEILDEVGPPEGKKLNGKDLQLNYASKIYACQLSCKKKLIVHYTMVIL